MLKHTHRPRRSPDPISFDSRTYFCHEASAAYCQPGGRVQELGKIFVLMKREGHCRTVVEQNASNFACGSVQNAAHEGLDLERATLALFDPVFAPNLR